MSDDFEIEIKAHAGNAEKEIEMLTSSLRKMKRLSDKGLGLSKISKEFSELFKVLENNSVIEKTVENLEKLEKLSKAKLNSSGVSRFASKLSSNAEKISVLADKISEKNNFFDKKFIRIFRKCFKYFRCF
jgi:hypothetical protein